MMKFLESTNSKITKDENNENVPRFEITKIVLVHCNTVNHDYRHNSRIFYTLVFNKLFG